MLRSTWFHIGSACMKASPSATASLIQSRTGPLARKDSWPERIGLVEGVGIGHRLQRYQRGKRRLRTMRRLRRTWLTIGRGLGAESLITRSIKRFARERRTTLGSWEGDL